VLRIEISVLPVSRHFVRNHGRDQANAIVNFATDYAASGEDRETDGERADNDDSFDHGYLSSQLPMPPISAAIPKGMPSKLHATNHPGSGLKPYSAAVIGAKPMKKNTSATTKDVGNGRRAAAARHSLSAYLCWHGTGGSSAG
jgi:hypothetical protein